MVIYAIGDVQGCYLELKALLEKINADTPDAKFLFAGDLVSRGPHSLETLRLVRVLGDRAITILGNHDLHLLAIAAGVRGSRRWDSLSDVLNAPDREELLEWLRYCPLAHLEGDNLVVHAGVLPQWTAQRTVELANEVELILRGPDWVAFLREMYGNKPAKWNEKLTGTDRLRCIVNGLTRLRFCNADGRMEFKTKDGIDSAPKGFMPWFEVPDRKTQDITIVFGHWSTLGLMMRPKLMALDTGCVWGGQLTAVRLEDRALYQIDCQGYRLPGDE